MIKLAPLAPGDKPADSAEARDMQGQVLAAVLGTGQAIAGKIDELTHDDVLHEPAVIEPPKPRPAPLF